MESISTQVYLAYLEMKASLVLSGSMPSFETWMRIQRAHRERINQYLYYGA